MIDRFRVLKFSKFLATLACTLTGMAASAENIHLSFVSFPVAHDIEPVELLIGEEDVVKAPLPSHTISRPISIPAQELWILGKSSRDENGAFSFEPYGQVRASTAMTQTLVVFRSEKNGKPSYEIIVLDSDRKGFSGGSQFFHNSADIAVKGQVGDKHFTLQPGEHCLLRAEADSVIEDRKTLSVKLIYEEKDSPPKTISMTWRFNDQVRYMVFIHRDEKTKRMNHHLLRNYAQLPAKPAP